MNDPRIEKLARVLVNYSMAVRKGDWVSIEGSDLSAPLIRAAYAEVLRAGAHPVAQVVVDGLEEIYYKLATDEQLRFISPTRVMEVEKLDAYLTIGGRANTKSLTNVDPKRIAARRSAVRDVTRRFLERMSTRELRWVGTQFPTQAAAQDAEMSLEEYADFVFSACFADRDDPVAEWKRVSADQERIVKALDACRTFRVAGEGTDLRFRAEGRKWVNCDGQANMPDGEVFTGPIEDSVEGRIRYTFPAVYGGREVEGVELTFREGKVVEARAGRGQEYLHAMIDMDEGARRVGEFAIGTNHGIRRFTRNILFDEKIGGTCHMALGASIPESRGKNVSALHWDMVCDLRKGGEIWADDKLIYREGKFVI